MLKDIDEALWPMGSLIGHVVSRFNTHHEEEVPFLHEGQHYVCWIKWTGFIELRTEVGRAMLDAVSQYATYQPSNHSGLITAHSYEGVVSVFTNDCVYYLQYGEVVRVMQSDRKRRSDELAAGYHKMSDGELRAALLLTADLKDEENRFLYDALLRDEFAARGQMDKFFDIRKRSYALRGA